MGIDFRASYAPSGTSVTFRAAEGFTGTAISIARGAAVRFDGLILEGEGLTVEVYGSLTVAGGKLGTVAVHAPVQGVSLAALTGDGTLSLTNAPTLGTVVLDDPAGGVVPSVDLTGFYGSVTVEISGDRPYGAFVTGIGDRASVTVEGGKQWQEGLSCREMRLQDGMYLCGGYDLTVGQTALGEVTLGGVCDPYLKELTVTVNGSAVALSADGGAFGDRRVDTGSAGVAQIGVGGGTSSLGLVYFDETTGLLTAPADAYVTAGGQRTPLDGLDPFSLPLNGDEATAVVDGQARTLDFCRPVGTAFVYRYLTDGGVLFTDVDYTNYERILAGKSVYDGMTIRQQGVVDEKLAETFGSFAALFKAAEDYLAAQNRKTEEFLEENEIFTKDFGDVTGSDTSALEDAAEHYRTADEEEKHFLDEAAKNEGYSGFEGMTQDLLAKAEFEAEREETLEDLGTILRGCDGSEVRRELSLAIETVEDAVYERCTDDDLRLDYLVGKKDSLATAVRVLENIRAEERAKSAFEAYLSEKRESECYSDDALKEMSSIVERFESSIAEIDPEDAEGGARIEGLLSEGMEELNGVRAERVVSGEGTPSSVLSGEYPDGAEELYGYLSKAEGYRGDSKLTLLLRPAGAETVDGAIVLFGVGVKLVGEAAGSAEVCLLLPGDARGYTGYRVLSRLESGEVREHTLRLEDDVLRFDTDGETELLVVAQRKVDLSWLIVLLSCLCGLETVALGYVVGYLFRHRVAALVPLLGAVIVPASAVAVCSVLGAVCVAEAVALVLLLVTIERRESPKRQTAAK